MAMLRRSSMPLRNTASSRPDQSPRRWLHQHPSDSPRQLVFAYSGVAPISAFCAPFTSDQLFCGCASPPRQAGVVALERSSLRIWLRPSRCLMPQPKRLKPDEAIALKNHGMPLAEVLDEL